MVIRDFLLPFLNGLISLIVGILIAYFSTFYIRSSPIEVFNYGKNENKTYHLAIKSNQDSFNRFSFRLTTNSPIDTIIVDDKELIISNMYIIKRIDDTTYTFIFGGKENVFYKNEEIRMLIKLDSTFFAPKIFFKIFPKGDSKDLENLLFEADGIKNNQIFYKTNKWYFSAFVIVSVVLLIMTLNSLSTYIRFRKINKLVSEWLRTDSSFVYHIVKGSLVSRKRSERKVFRKLIDLCLDRETMIDLIRLKLKTEHSDILNKEPNIPESMYVYLREFLLDHFYANYEKSFVLTPKVVIKKFMEYVNNINKMIDERG